MYEARKLANFLLNEFDACAFDLSNMKINKLLYFIHGWGYVRMERKIIRNHFVAWDYGPVVKSVYDSFKEFGSQPIPAPARFMNYKTGKTEIIPFDDIDDECIKLILTIVPHYISKSTAELVAITHVLGGPWDAVRKSEEQKEPMFSRIPDQLISDYFKIQFGGYTRN